VYLIIQLLNVEANITNRKDVYVFIAEILNIHLK